MSNQVSLMLSFIFLAFFIILSGEVISYQRTVAKTYAITSEIAVFIEKNGYEQQEIDDFDYMNYLDSFTVTSSIDTINNCVEYSIIATKQYNAFSQLYDYMSQEIICEMKVYRKE